MKVSHDGRPSGGRRASVLAPLVPYCTKTRRYRARTIARTNERDCRRHPQCCAGRGAIWTAGLPHASLGSFGWVEGGAQAMVAAFLAEACTVIVPTFSWGFAVPPPASDRPARNGWDYDEFPGPAAGLGRVYNPSSNEIDRDMGAVPAAVLLWPGRWRGDHPLSSFSAAGPLAGVLISAQRPWDVWAPLRALVEAGGSVVLMGVGFDSMTLLHLAEQMAGRKPFVRWANGPDGRPMGVQVGGCSNGFHKFEPVLRPLTTSCRVGNSLWQVVPARQAVEQAAAAIRKRPRITHCAAPGCGRCRDAVLGGPIAPR